MAAPSRKAKKHSTAPASVPQMPFDEALRRILAAPPQHKEVPKKKKRHQKSKGS